MMTSASLRFHQSLAAATLVFAAVSASSQAAPSITGTIQDSQGIGIGSAQITLRNDATHAAVNTIADKQGHFTSAPLRPGSYTVEVVATGFALARRQILLTDHNETLNLPLAIESANEQVTVEADATHSVAAQYAPMDGLLEARSARTEISNAFIQNFTSPDADFSEIIQMAPGTFSINSNGVGLGDSKTYFRGFPDGDYDITFDGIPFEDTNSPTHHSWAFFPAPWVGGVDFDRSPGDAATVGPTPFGGSINLLSRELSPVLNIRGGVSYGSFNTLLTDVQVDSGNIGTTNHQLLLTADFNRLTSDGFQTGNAQERNAGALKAQFKLSPKTTLTGFSGVLLLDTNTPNTKGPTRAQVNTLGYNYLLQSTDSTQANYAAYNFYHVPTDFEYVGIHSDLTSKISFDVKPYTYSYYNQQNYAAQPKTGAVNLTNCVPVATKATATSAAVSIQPCGTDKLNSYRKYGETSTVNFFTGKYGVIRTGMWYEWATTSRHQIPQNPITGADDLLPNFNEQFYTTSYQPFAEYEYHATSKLTLTGGFKYAHYNMNLTQYADNGKTIGNINPITKQPFTVLNHNVGYNAYMPSFDANYRLKPNLSVYAQYATGSIIPPSNVFDVASATVGVPPKPTTAYTFQGGTVYKQKFFTANADFYYTHFGNGYTAPADPNGVVYSPADDSVSKGFEGEAKFYLTHGFNFYANGTAGSAHYVSPLLTSASSTTATTIANPNYQQWIPINPFNVDNLFLNYTIRSNSHLDGTKLRFSANNLLNTQNITSLSSGTTAVTGTAFAPSNGDTLGLTPGRSFTVSIILGYAPNGRY